MRYSRQIILPEIGESGQLKLQNASVLVIGAGGLGCPVLQNLAAAGVGNIGIVDGDVVDETNLHRQLLYGINDISKTKAKRAAAVILENNPDLNVKVFPVFFNSENASEIVSNYQIIVDCTDTIAVRYLINDVALAKRIPVVYASIHKFEGQVSVFNYKNGPSYRCLFPENDSLNTVPSCAVSGVLGVLPNTIGTLQATEVLKIILEIGKVLSGKLLFYDGLHFQTQIIDYAKNPKAIESGMINGLKILNAKPTSIENLTIDDFNTKIKDLNVLIIDIREGNTISDFESSNLVHIPASSLKTQALDLNKNKEILLFCQTGQISKAALNYLKREGFTKVSHLEKGISQLQ